MRFLLILILLLTVGCSSSEKDKPVYVKVLAQGAADTQSPVTLEKGRFCNHQFIIYTGMGADEYLITVSDNFAHMPIIGASLTTDNLNFGSHHFHNDSDDTDFHAKVTYHSSIGTGNKLRSLDCVENLR